MKLVSTSVKQVGMCEAGVMKLSKHDTIRYNTVHYPVCSMSIRAAQSELLTGMWLGTD